MKDLEFPLQGENASMSEKEKLQRDFSLQIAHTLQLEYKARAAFVADHQNLTLKVYWYRRLWMANKNALAILAEIAEMETTHE